MFKNGAMIELSTRAEVSEMLRHIAPVECWPLKYRRFLFSEVIGRSQIFLKRDDRFRLTRMIVGNLPIGGAPEAKREHAQDRQLITNSLCCKYALLVLGPFLRDDDARNDIANTCKRIDEAPDETMYFDVLLQENRYFSGRVPACVQQVRKHAKVLQRQQHSFDEYLFYCAQTGKSMPLNSACRNFFLSDCKSARDYFESL